MNFADIYRSRDFVLSFELFPPKTDAGEQALTRHVEHLMEFHPRFLTCTYGAGGSTQEKTLRIISGVRRQFDVPVASHLTVVGATVDQLRSYLQQATNAGIQNIVALRGDPPQGEATFQKVAGGLGYANELVELIRAEFPHFGIAVAAYPETHQEAPSAEADLQNLKRKIEAGADVAITQLFYDNADFYRFRDRYREAGIECPLVPGILPVTNLAQIQRITSLCGARLPQSFVDELGRQEDEEWQFQVGVEFATRQVEDLLKNGVPGIHFYVLNKSGATSEVLRRCEVAS